MNMNDAQSSDPRTDVSHQVSVDPVDDAGINGRRRFAGLQRRARNVELILG